jgi:hypothetical protein
VRAVFADTFYFLALLNRRDSHHDRAVAESRKRGLQLVTTDLIIVELADALCKPEYRQEVIAIWRILETDNDSSVVEVSAALLWKGRELYAARSDKDWPLTDCVSFVVMQELGLTDALTADRHFNQAGFNSLLL